MPEDKGKMRSVARTKKSAITLLDALGPEVLGTLVPGLGLAYKLSEILITHAWEFHVDRRKARIDEFHQTLLYGADEKDFESFLNKPFSIEDYYTLLDSAVHDQEDAKIPVYSKFFSALIEQTVPQTYKIHLIKALKELTCSDLDLLREIYISSKHDFVKEGGRNKQLREIVETADPIKSYSVQTFLRLGFIRLTGQGFGDTKGTPTPTDLLEAFMNAAFDQDELTPEAIGKKAWKQIGFVFIVIPDTEKYNDLMVLLKRTLTDLSIRSLIVPVQKGEPHVNLRISAGLIVCLDAKAGEKGSAMSSFMNHPQIKNRKIIKILLSASPDGAGFDPLPDLPALASFNFVSLDSYETQKFAEFVRESVDAAE
jgi:hypothetical protein